MTPSPSPSPTPPELGAASHFTVSDPLDAGHLQERLAARDHRRGGVDPLLRVRASDLEPYTGLGYLSKLFRLIAVLLLVLLVAEVGTGVYSEGVGALRTLITEASRLIVVAGVLWGAGDLATLLIDIGHDVRATRILLGRQAPQGEGLLDPSSAARGDRDVAPGRAARADAPPQRDDVDARG